MSETPQNPQPNRPNNRLEIGDKVAIHKGPRKPYKVLEFDGKRIIVTDDKTSRKNLPIRNVRPWSEVEEINEELRVNKKKTTNFETLDQELAKIKGATDSKRKFSASELQKITSLRSEMEASGIPGQLAGYGASYRESDIACIYTGGEPQEMTNGGPEGGKVKVGLIVGTDIPLAEIVANSKYLDQTPHVNVQWWSHEYTTNPNKPKEIERLELEEIRPGVYVQRTFNGVSSLGHFDGELRRIALYIEDPSQAFHPQSRYPGRKMYRIYEYYKTKDQSKPWHAFGLNLSGASLLNGVQQLIAYHMPELSILKESDLKTLQLTSNTDGKVLSSNLPALKQEDQLMDLEAIAKQHQVIVERMRTETGKMLPLALRSLEDDHVAHNMIDMMVDGILRYPDRINILGHSLNMIDPKRRFHFAQVISKEGLEMFRSWYDTHLKSDMNNQTTDRIIARNLLHFVQFWNIHTKGLFSEPDWEAMTKAHEITTSRLKVPVYPLYVKSFDGLQTSAMETFIEDYISAHMLDQMPELKLEAGTNNQN